MPGWHSGPVTSAESGYSGTPLPAKLGIRPGHRLLLSGLPDGWPVERLAVAGATVHRRAGAGAYDVVLAFAPDRRALERQLARLAPRITPAGALWFAWPKRSSGVPTDLTEDTLREVVLPTGLVDTKVCAIDATWSGLKFVWRSHLRPR